MLEQCRAFRIFLSIQKMLKKDRWRVNPIRIQEILSGKDIPENKKR
jgi:hypothetical protein